MMSGKLKRAVILLAGILLYICSIRQSTQIEQMAKISTYIPQNLYCTGQSAKEIIEEKNMLLCSFTENTWITDAELGNTAEVNMVRYVGNEKLLSPELQDIYVQDGNSCVIDSKTAEEIYGSQNVVGKNIFVNGERYRIKQVVYTPEKTILIQLKDYEEARIDEIRTDNGNLEEKMLLSTGVVCEKLNYELLDFIAKVLLVIVPFVVIVKAFRKEHVVQIILIVIYVVWLIRMGNLHIPESVVIHKLSEFELWKETILQMVGDIEKIVSNGNHFLKFLIYNFSSLICVIIGTEVFDTYEDQRCGSPCRDYENKYPLL